MELKFPKVPPILLCQILFGLLTLQASQAQYCTSLSDCPGSLFCCENNQCCSRFETAVTEAATITVGVIIAIVVGTIIGIVACIVGCVFCCCRNTNNRGQILGRPTVQTTTVHTSAVPATRQPVPQQQYPIGQAYPQPMNQQAMAYPPQPVPNYPAPAQGYPGPGQPTPNPAPPPYNTSSAHPYPGAPGQSEPYYPTKDGVQASAPPPY